MKRIVSIVIVLTLVLGLLIPTTTFAYHDHYFEYMMSLYSTHPHKARYECDCGEMVFLKNAYDAGCEECLEELHDDYGTHNYQYITYLDEGLDAECDCGKFKYFENEEEWHTFCDEEEEYIYDLCDELNLELANESYEDSKEDVYIDLESMFSKNAERNHPHPGTYKNHNGVDVYLDQALNSKCRYCINEELCSTYDAHSCLYDYEEYDDYFEFICFCGKTTKVHRKRLNDFFEDRERDNKATVEELNEILASQEYHNSYVANSIRQPEVTYTENNEKSTLNAEFTYPETLSYGLKSKITGDVTSNYLITLIHVFVENEEGAKVMEAVLYPNATAVNIDETSTINEQIDFSRLSPGNYTINFVLRDSKEEGSSSVSLEILDDGCPTVTGPKILINFTQAPEVIAHEGVFNLKGSIESSDILTAVYGYIKDASGRVLVSTYDAPNSTRMNIETSRLNYDTPFNKLSNGTYTLSVTAYDASGAVETHEFGFVVNRATKELISSDSEEGMIVYYRNFSPSFFEVVKEAPLRSIPYKEGTALAKIKEGTILRLTGKCYNDKGNIFYIMEVDGEKGYIYAGNVTEYLAADGNSKWQSFLDDTSMVLTAVSIVPYFDTVTNVAATIVDLLRGDFVGVGLSALGIVPAVGEIGDAIKTVSKRDELLKTIKNTKLWNTANDLYRPGAVIGDGGTADSIRHYLKTGELVGGSTHIQKGEERVRNLKNILETQDLNATDRKIAYELLEDLISALEGN